MEGNKDEALRCLQLTRRAIELQDYAKALRMAERAQRMFPTSEGAAYVSICTAKLNASATSASSSSCASSSGSTAASAAREAPAAGSERGEGVRGGASNLRQRHHAREGAPPSSAAPQATAYSSSYAQHARTSAGGGGASASQTSSPSAASPGPSRTQSASFASGSARAAEGRGGSTGASTLPRSASSPGAGAGGDAKSGSRGNYTAEQVSLCTRVLTTKCYYQTLGVERTATDEVIKKAYKKLALQLHPDKNRAPHAEEAFKKVAKVSQCLLDSEKRKRYDLVGEDEAASENTRVRYRQDPDGGITPEELFQAFFGFTMGDRVRGRPGQARYYYQRRPQRGNEEQAGGLYYFLQILPMAIMFIIMFVGNFFPSSSPLPPAHYSFTQTTDYPIDRLTRYHSVRFYVSPYFRRDFPDESERLRELEMSIELKFYHNKCQKEKEDLSRQLNVAHYYRASEAKVREILDRPRPHCQIYDTLWSQRTRRS
ncbi:DnaJ domain-containing protein [Besnoitia besnoiti]|uniref:DnaJ domain-containing protein n=1 Tax=Besnoitia besnoiti TaxID=94643 RepID=A0A2A9MJ38_BESBE|nr:DnaJ domain-containing protein [Besnoitia besnoiti]PFH37985.1 DnaJ domain-containing protein [Besnoitia besnoiti]